MEHSQGQALLGVCDERQAPAQAAAGILIFQINGFWLRQKTLLGSRLLFEALRGAACRKRQRAKAALQNDCIGNLLLQSISVYFVSLLVLICGRREGGREKGKEGERERQKIHTHTS